jgi:hypothetical protein
MPQILIRAHKNPFTVADADTTYRQRRTVTDLGRELHIAYNDLNGGPRGRSRSRTLSHRAWNQIDRAVRSLSSMA